ncbi:hypothetical protein ACM3BL_15095 [Mammaliicoccus sciuri]|nr:hypothetical protein [Mammaliicoccus sciuri]MDT0709459.1 hypothetical protein [Mammaliicoccus sciuri]MDT0756555.1 hypothetical protein [Mammaliicoccus sciuri]
MIQKSIKHIEESAEGVLKMDGDKASITTELNGEMTFERKN